MVASQIGGEFHDDRMHEMQQIKEAENQLANIEMTSVLCCSKYFKRHLCIYIYNILNNDTFHLISLDIFSFFL